MSKLDVIQRVQKLLDDLNKETDESIFNFIDTSLKDLESENSYYSYFCKDTKKEIDELQFSKNFKKNKMKYFNENIEEIKVLCDFLDIDYTELKNKELYELLLKPETVTIIKDRLFENIKNHINKGAKYYSDNMDGFNEQYSFDHCRYVLINYLYKEFKEYYIFNIRKLYYFLIDGDVDIDIEFFHDLCRKKYEYYHEEKSIDDSDTDEEDIKEELDIDTDE